LSGRKFSRMIRGRQRFGTKESWLLKPSLDKRIDYTAAVSSLTIFSITRENITLILLTFRLLDHGQQSGECLSRVLRRDFGRYFYYISILRYFYLNNFISFSSTIATRTRTTSLLTSSGRQIPSRRLQLTLTSCNNWERRQDSWIL
jgi:hypothetical protein